jgi:hypothetical protein
VGEGRGKGEGTWGAEDPSHINIYENNTMKPLNTALKRWGWGRELREYSKGGKLSKYIVHIYGIITMNPLVLLVYDKKKLIN